MGVLLAFLWNVVPREPYGRPLSLPRVPAIPADWFTVLTDRYPAVQDSCGNHIAACRLAAAYEHRLRTAPRGHSMGRRRQTWQERFTLPATEHSISVRLRLQL